MTENMQHPRQVSGGDFPYFRSAWKRVVTTLLLAALLPFVLIGGSLYFYAAVTLKQNTIAALENEVTIHKTVIDRYLHERNQCLEVVSTSLCLLSPERPDLMEAHLAKLHGELPCFTDLGVITTEGDHRAYSGPYDLIDKNYREADWFRQVMTRGEVVSDVFMGHRREPHFIVARKLPGPAGDWIIRATINATDFRSLVSKGGQQSNADTYIINREGLYQTRPRSSARLMDPSLIGEQQHFNGVRLIEKNGTLSAAVWLKAAPWLCVVRIEKREVFAELYRVCQVGMLAFLAGSCLIVLTVLKTTNTLVRRLEFKRRNIRFLDQQLRRTSLMASTMHLSRSVLAELSSGLATLSISTSWIAEQLASGKTEELRESLKQVGDTAIHGKQLIEKLQVATSLPEQGHVITSCDVNIVISDLLELLSWETYQCGIKVQTDLQPTLPALRSDHAHLRQVLQNILLNAIAAVRKGGVIHIQTRLRKPFIEIIVTDSGAGIPPENMDKIFKPLFTTRSDSVGLGLSVSRSILDRMKGDVTVENKAGMGACFTVSIPIRINYSNH